MSLLNVLELIIFAGLLVFLYWLRRPGVSLARQVFIALILGVAFGFFLQLIHGGDISAIRPTLDWTDLPGARDTSIIAVVIFGMLFGLAALLVSREKPEHADRIVSTTDTLQTIIMRLVRIVMSLTPYGILSLMTSVIASSSGSDILEL